MDVSFSKANFESSRRRGGGFSSLTGGACIRPLPAPCLTWVTALGPSAIKPTTGSIDTFGCLSGRSDFGGCFLLPDDPGTLGTTISPVFFCSTARDFIIALLLASSISAIQDG